MGTTLNDMEMNGAVLENLYRKTLVLVPSAEAAASAPRYLGNYARNILILVNDPGSGFLADEHLSFLTKILGACKLNIGDVAIVNLSHSAPAAEVIASLRPETLISFGTDVDNDESRPTLVAPALGLLAGDSTEAKALKAKLWNSLKQMFGIA